MLSHWLDFDQSSRRIVLAHICSPVGKYDWSSLLMTHSLHLWAYFSQSPDTYCGKWCSYKMCTAASVRKQNDSSIVYTVVMLSQCATTTRPAPYWQNCHHLYIVIQQNTSFFMNFVNSQSTTVSVTTVECLALMSCFFPRATAQQIIVLFALTQEEPYQTSAMQGTEWAAQVW